MPSAPSLRHRISGAFHRIGRFHSKWLAIIPILLLLYDFNCFRCIFTKYEPKEKPSVEAFRSNRPLLLGTYNCRTIHASNDDLRANNYLDYLAGSDNAIVISYVLDTSLDPPDTHPGEIAEAFYEKLNSVSSAGNAKLQEEVKILDGSAVGQMVSFASHVPREKYASLPINRIYVVVLNDFDKNKTNAKALDGVIQKVLVAAREDKISSLVIPCLGQDWDTNAWRFNEFFEPLLRTIGADKSTGDIYLPFYTNWRTKTLERALNQFNLCWNDRSVSGTNGALLGLLNADYRSPLLFLGVCLLVSSFYAPLTVKNLLIISASFAAVAATAIRAIDFITQGDSTAFSIAFKTITWISLAIFFPFVVNWNPKDVFSSQNNDDK